jgi:hypothetical protein
MKNNNKIVVEEVPKNIETKKIAKAAPFEIDKNGFVYRRSPQGKLKKMKQRYVCSRWYATIRNDEGRSWTFDSERLAESMFNKPKTHFTKEDVFEKFEVRMIPEWARYVITPYGAIYCVDPPKRGRNAGKCFLLREFLMSGGHPYVTLYHSDGTRRNKRVATLVAEVWGKDSALL